MYSNHPILHRHFYVERVVESLDILNLLIIITHTILSGTAKTIINPQQSVKQKKRDVFLEQKYASTDKEFF